MNDKQRAYFDSWYTEKYGDMWFDSQDDELSFIDGCKSAWQAAIASVVVELPKVYRDAYADDYTKATADGREYAIDDFKQSLKEAGIRYE